MDLINNKKICEYCNKDISLTQAFNAGNLKAHIDSHIRNKHHKTAGGKN